MKAYYGMNVQTVGLKLSGFLKLYHESLASLVQGYREVTMDAQGTFRFEDTGETVKERLDKYRKKLEERTTGVVSQSVDAYEEMKKNGK